MFTTRSIGRPVQVIEYEFIYLAFIPPIYPPKMLLKFPGVSRWLKSTRSCPIPPRLEIRRLARNRHRRLGRVIARRTSQDSGGRFRGKVTSPISPGTLQELPSMESVQRTDGVHARDHGYVFEVPASPAPVLNQAEPLVAMGRFEHEAVAVDPVSGAVYQAEDKWDGLIYRYLPDRLRGARFYLPSERGYERHISDRMARWRAAIEDAERGADRDGEESEGGTGA